MQDVKIVIGANFGDEGKGLMTDYFCSIAPKHERVLNVRFNGGSQAGHTVVSPDGRRHIFGHFGSGSFLPNVATYFASDFIVNPIIFRREYEKLNQLKIYPMVYCHPKCIFTMPQDMMVNQFLETRRGNARHGSCGIGIYETILRNKNATPENTINYLSVASADGMPNIDYYDYERIDKLLGDRLTDEEKALMINQNIHSRYCEDVRFFLDHVVIKDESIFDQFNYVVFEGAQGLLLDQNNMDYFPHLTPSNTGIQNVVPYLANSMSIKVCYVTRPYLTRHGAGMLPNECSREEVGAKNDLTNHSNEWQGSLRYGKLHWPSLMERIIVDFQKIGDLDAERVIALTHHDEMITTVQDLKGLGVTYISEGPMRSNIKNIYKEVDTYEAEE